MYKTFKPVTVVGMSQIHLKISSFGKKLSAIYIV